MKKYVIAAVSVLIIFSVGFIMYFSNIPHILGDSVISDGRKALLPGSYEGSVCRAEYNGEKPTVTVTYENKEKGLFFAVPYNPNWGNKDFYIPPYVELMEDGPKLFFGNISIEPEGGCGLGRDTSLYFLPPRPFIKEMEDVEKWVYSGSENFMKPTKKILNGLTVIEFDMVGQELGCEKQSTVRVIGEKYNYWLLGNCGEGFQEFESLIKNMKLIK